MAKISVIIPVYNVEKYLVRCLDSVCQQTLQDIEVICVNDCSPDNSLDILNAYATKDNRIKVINFKKNQGVAVARNSGMELATGQYLAFLDSDDWLDLDFYEKLYNKATTTNSDLVIGNIKEYKNGETSLFPFLEKIKQNKHNFMGLFVLGLYKKSLLDSHSIKFIKGISYGEDRLLPIGSTLLANNVETIDDSFYYYDRSTENSVTMQSTLSKKNIDDFFISTKQIFEFLDKNDIPQDIYKIYEKAFFEQANDIILALPNNRILQHKPQVLELYELLDSKYPLEELDKTIYNLYKANDFVNIAKQKQIFEQKARMQALRANILKNKK